MTNKPPPPPSKLPPPPPPPPKNVRPPPPPPPPPPRNSSQISGQSIMASNQHCTVLGGASGSILLPNNGSSISSVNSAGRCSHFQSMTPSTNNHGSQRGLTKYSECGSRSSISSHGSAQHHHHVTPHATNANANSSLSNFGLNTPCGHQTGPGCCWSNAQHNHPTSSSMSDNGSCNLNYNQENIPKSTSQASCNNCCSNSHHPYNQPTRFQQPTFGSNSNIRMANLNGNTLPTSNLPMGRNNSAFNAADASINVNSIPNGHCCGDDLSRGHLPHHHNHHNNGTLHTIQLSSGSSLSSLQPVDPGNPFFHRCNIPSQSNLATQVHPNTIGESTQRSTITHQQCGHVHRMNGCNHHHHHHHPIECSTHHNISSTVEQLQMSQMSPTPSCGCGTCPHVQNGSVVHHDCNSANNIPPKVCPAGTHYHCSQVEMMPSRYSDVSNNETTSAILSTAHTHNLSNSSTTTHTSNVAVKHQPQFHGPVLSRGGRSSSSQQYDQYGLSSAASTSSATASLSSYQTPIAYDDLVPFYPSSKINQPLPPPPTHQTPMSHAKSQPASPAHQMFMNYNNNGNQAHIPIIQSTLMNSNQITQMQLQQNQQQQHQAPQPPPAQAQQQSIVNMPLPPLPPKPVSPNASSCSTQITTVRTSPSLQNQPITRVTSQAGVQTPLPKSDIPPPLPPLKSSLRTQPIINSSMTRIQVGTNGPNDNISNSGFQNFVSLNYNRGGIMTEAGRKTEALTRQVELELEQQQNAAEPHGICPKCGTKVMPAQEACKAMNQIFHANCFVCCECGRTLLGKTFYPVGDKVYCEEDFKYTGHMQSLEKCAACSQPIFNMILPAMGKFYHPKCFKCSVCSMCLDGKLTSALSPTNCLACSKHKETNRPPS